VWECMKAMPTKNPCRKMANQVHRLQRRVRTTVNASNGPCVGRGQQPVVGWAPASAAGGGGGSA